MPQNKKHLFTFLVLVLFINTDYSLAGNSSLQDSSFITVKFRVYYDEVPDSLTINGKLFKIKRYGQIIKVQKNEKYMVSATKSGMPYKITLPAKILKYRPNNLLIKQAGKATRFRKFYTENPFVFQIPAATASTGLSLFSLRSPVYQEYNKILFYSAAGQSLLWLLKNYFKYEPETGMNSAEHPVHISAGVSNFMTNLFFQTPEKMILLPPLVAYQKWEISTSNPLSFFMDFEMHLTKRIFFDLNMHYARTVYDIKFNERVSIGLPPKNTVEYNDRQKTENSFLVIFNSNFNFLNITNQQLAVSLGGYWITDSELSSSFLITNEDHYYNVPDHETDEYNYKISGQGVCAGFSFQSVLTERFSFLLSTNFLFNVKIKHYKKTENKILPVVSSGLRYNF